MALFKMIDGERVQCTASEEADIRAAWAKDDIERAARKPQKYVRPDDLVQLLIAKGIIKIEEI